MKRIIFALTVAAFSFSACDQNEEIVSEGTLKGHIITKDEFGEVSDDRQDILLVMKSPETYFTTITDSLGEFIFEGIPMDTYVLEITKESYGKREAPGVDIYRVEGYTSYASPIVALSKTTVEDLSMEYINSNQIRIKGTVHHNFTLDNTSGNNPNIRYFIHTQRDPSISNYLQSGVLEFEGNSGTEIESTIDLNSDLFKPGSELFLVAYGMNPEDVGYYDMMACTRIYSSCDEPSNIFSITLP